MLIQADSLHIPLRDNSVHCAITSPPYFGLRQYEGQPTVWGGDPLCQHRWGQFQSPLHPGQIDQTKYQKAGLVVGNAQNAPTGRFCGRCGAWEGFLGLEPAPDLYVAHLAAIFEEVRRVLRPEGTLWLNIGDSYASSGGHTVSEDESGGIRGGRRNNKQRQNAKGIYGPSVGLKPKDLIGIPWMTAFALRAAGWWLRSEIIWFKKNPMPESVTDRPTRGHEQVFLFAKSGNYFCDMEAIKEPHTDSSQERYKYSHHGHDSGFAKDARTGSSYRKMREQDLPMGEFVNPSGRNKRTVWEISSGASFSGEHYAAFPQSLVLPCLLAGTSAHGVCADCGSPYERIVEREEIEADDEGNYGAKGSKWKDQAKQSSGQRIQHNLNRLRTAGRDHDNPYAKTWTAGWEKTCDCKTSEVMPATVLDPFCGTGTTGLVAKKLGRRFVGLDLSFTYLQDFAMPRAEGLTSEAAIKSLPLFADP